MRLATQQEEADVYRGLLRDKKKRMEIFRSLPLNKQGFLLLRFSKPLRQKVLAELRDDEVVELVDYLDFDQATDVLQAVLSASRRERIFNQLAKSVQGKIEFLLQFHPNTAAGMMDLNYVEVLQSASFEDAALAMDVHQKNTGRIPTVLVVDDGLLVGQLSPQVMALHPKTSIVKDHVRPVPVVHCHQNKEEVVSVFTNSPHNKVVVLDDDESILGIIYADDIIRLLAKERGSSLYDFAGVKDEEDVFDSVQSKVKHRYKWLILNLITAFLAAAVVSLFDETISKFVLLAAYMPIVAGMGGNAATQTLAVTVRGIALGEIELKNSGRAIASEVGAGLINGVINGILVAGVAYFWNESPLLGLIIGAAMVVNLIVAGFFGALIPLILKKAGKDPATSATIFITTATDVLGFFVFLGLASVLL